MGAKVMCAKGLARRIGAYIMYGGTCCMKLTSGTFQSSNEIEELPAGVQRL